MNPARIVRYARRQAGLTQRELAQRAGVPQPAIARIESGAVSPRLDTVERLLAATGWTLELAPQIGGGVDRTLIRAALKKSPEGRVRAATEAAHNLATFLRATTDASNR